MKIASLALLVLIGAARTASAQTPAYVGTWASQTSQCRVGQEEENAPLVMRRDGYDQHEAHCTFSNVRQNGASWSLRAACTVEGNRQAMNLTLSVANNRLTMRDEHGARTLDRCR